MSRNAAELFCAKYSARRNLLSHDPFLDGLHRHIHVARESGQADHSIIGWLSFVAATLSRRFDDLHDDV